jgi:hypothetical protein
MTNYAIISAVLGILGVACLVIIPNSLLAWTGLGACASVSFALLFIGDYLEGREKEQEKIASLERRIQELEKKPTH